MQERFGKEAFDIIPDTYNLPDEFADFYNHFHKLNQQESSKQDNLWIVKPTNSCQGKGIFIIDDISEVPLDEPCIISRYIPNPLLINGLKFDIRLYVLVTSMDPLRIHVFHEGLARFASEEYSLTTIKSNKFSHLTNYSINKKSEKFVQNTDANQGDEGHKWSLSALCKHFEQMGIDNDLLWSKIYDVIIKSIISVEGSVTQHLKRMQTRNNCFELFGFDILIDSNLKPWLVEVNLSPSLACDSPLDFKIKQQVFTSTMNLICMKKFDRRREGFNKIKQKGSYKSNVARAKSYLQKANTTVASAYHGAVSGPQGNFKNLSPEKGDRSLSHSKNDQKHTVAQQHRQVFDKLQYCNTRMKDVLRETLQEHFRKGGFLRIFPSFNSHVYDRLFEGNNTTSKAAGSGLSNFQTRNSTVQPGVNNSNYRSFSTSLSNLQLSGQHQSAPGQSLAGI